MSGTSALVAAHVICTTLGYGALIVANVWLALNPRTAERAVLEAQARSALTVSRIFGPLLGIGVLLGIAALAVTKLPAFSPWLVTTYALIVLALLIQGVVAIPWHIRAQRALAAGSIVDRPRTPALVAAAFTLIFALIITMMVAKP